MSFVISNTVVSNNGRVGIYYLPPSGTPSANGVIDHVVATNNDFGIDVDTFSISGRSTMVAISNGIASNNQEGIVVIGESGSLAVSIDNTSVSANYSVGIDAQSAATVLLGRSVITANFVGVSNTTSLNAFFTDKDNRINANYITDVSGALLTETLQ
jgi:hypothetical protein